MRLDRIECQNFFNHKRTELDLRQYGSPLLIQGENGGGKSSLFTEALTFALFGETRMASIDDAIRNDSSEMGVSIKFNLNSQDVEIMRTKKRGKSAKLHVSINGETVDELLSETQKRIDKMFGLSYDSFLSSVLLKQEEADFFIKRKPDERKKIIGEILDLGAYERLEKLARERRTTLKTEMKVEEAAYNAIDLKDADELQSRSDKLNAFLERANEQLEACRGELNAVKTANALVEEQKRNAEAIHQNNLRVTAMIKQLRSKVSDNVQSLNYYDPIAMPHNDNSTWIALREEQIVKTEQSIADDQAGLQERIRVVADKKEKLNKVILAMLNDLMEHRRKTSEPLQALQAEANLIEARLKKIQSLNEPECPTCFRAIDHEVHQSIVRSLNDELHAVKDKVFHAEEPVREIQAKIEALNKRDVLNIQLMEQHITETEQKMQSAQLEVMERKVALQDLRHQVMKKREEQQVYNDAVTKVALLDKQVQEYTETIDALEQQVQSEPQMHFEVKETISLQNKIETLDTQRQQAVQMASKTEHELEANQQATERKETLGKVLKEKLRTIDLLDKLCLAFSRKGIPASIISTVLPEIQEITNHFLFGMSDGRLKIAFKTSEVQKNGNEKDTLDIEVFDGTQWRKFESFSGGEQFRISLSIRLALSKVLARRANIDLQLLILDEAATSLDQHGREEFVRTIKSLKTDFSRIILMSHIPELADEFDQRLTVRQTTDGTKLIQR